MRNKKEELEALTPSQSCDHEVIKFQTVVSRRNTPSNTLTVGVGRADFGLLKEQGSMNAGHFLRAISEECRSRQFQSVGSQGSRAEAGLAEQGSSRM